MHTDHSIGLLDLFSIKKDLFFRFTSFILACGRFKFIDNSGSHNMAFEILVEKLCLRVFGNQVM